MVWKILIVDDWCGDITIRDGIWLGHFPTHFTILFIPKWVLLIYAVRWLIFIPCDSIGESDSIYSYTCMAQNEALQQKFNRFYPVQMNCGKVDSEMTDCTNRIITHIMDRASHHFAEKMQTPHWLIFRQSLPLSTGPAPPQKTHQSLISGNSYIQEMMLLNVNLDQFRYLDQFRGFL